MVKIKKYKDEIEKEVYKQMDVYKNILNAELVINAIRAVMYEHDKITNPSYKKIIEWLASDDYDDFKNEPFKAEGNEA